MSISRRYFVRNPALAAMGSGFVIALPMEVLANLRRNVSAAEKLRSTH